MRAIVIFIIFIFLTTACALLLISSPQHGPTWALALSLPLIWLAQAWAAAVTPLASPSGLIAAHFSPARLALNAYAIGQFALLGALWLGLPIYWLMRGGGMPAALGCAAAATAWLVLYRRRWAYPMWVYFQEAHAHRLNVLARELEAHFWQSPEGSARAGQLFWLRGIWVNALDAGMLLLPLLLLLPAAFTEHQLRNWLSYCCLLLPSLSLLRVQLSAPAVTLADESEIAHSERYHGLSGAFDSLESVASAHDEAQSLDDAFAMPWSPKLADKSEAEIQISNVQANPRPTEANAGAEGASSTTNLTEQQRSEAVTDPGSSKDLLLQRAVIRGDATAVSNLLKRGANPNALPLANAPDQRTPLVIACASGGLAIIKLLIAGGADVNGKNGDITPLLAATRDTWSGRFDVVMTLLTNGADVAARDNRLVGALHGAARSTDVALLQLLLESGANIDQIDAENYSALARAVQSGQTDNVLALLKSNATFDAAGMVSLARALSLCREPDAQLLECVVARVKIEATDVAGNTALHFCALENAAEFAEALVIAGANVNAKNNLQQTPIMLAARAQSLRTVHRLCLGKVNPAMVDSDGNTALHHAVMAEPPKLEIIEILLKLGCAPQRTNTGGVTAAELALKAARWDLARRLSPAQELSDELEGELERSHEDIAPTSYESGPKREQLLVQAAQAGRFAAAQALLKLGPVDQHTHLQILIALGDQLDSEWLAELIVGGLQLGKLEVEPKICALARQVPPPLVAIQVLLDAGAAISADV